MNHSQREVAEKILGAIEESTKTTASALAHIAFTLELLLQHFNPKAAARCCQMRTGQVLYNEDQNETS